MVILAVRRPLMLLENQLPPIYWIGFKPDHEPSNLCNQNPAHTTCMLCVICNIFLDIIENIEKNIPTFCHTQEKKWHATRTPLIVAALSKIGRIMKRQIHLAYRNNKESCYAYDSCLSDFIRHSRSSHSTPDSNGSTPLD